MFYAHVQPRGSRFIPKWLRRRPKFSLRPTNPYSNLGQDDLIEREYHRRAYITRKCTSCNNERSFRNVFSCFYRMACKFAGEIYNPVVERPELWPHETPDIWAVPAVDTNKENQVSPGSDRSACVVERDSMNNNLSAITSKSRAHTDSHSSIELEWENEEGE